MKLIIFKFKKHKNIFNKKQKNKVELSTEFAISFCLFFNTFSILSILDPLETRIKTPSQRTKDEFFGVKDEFFGVKDEFFGVKDELNYDIIFT